MPQSSRQRRGDGGVRGSGGGSVVYVIEAAVLQKDWRRLTSQEVVRVWGAVL